MSPATACTPTVASVPLRVLIVDDAQDDREMYALFLTTVGGCSVTEASSGRDALEKIEAHHPDIVVLDVMLPDVDGAEICRRVRSSPASEKTTIVTVTALPLQSADIDRMISAGTDAILIKPCAPETLLGEIRALLKQSRALRPQGQNARDRAAALRTRSEQLQRRHTESPRITRQLLRTAEHLTLSQRVHAHYMELPGLSLTSRQATRLFGFEESVCQGVLDMLTSEGYLIEVDGQYRRPGM